MRAPVFFVLFNNGKPARADIIKAQGLYLTRLDENRFRRAVQHKAIHGLDLPRRNGGAGDQVMDNDAAILIGDETLRCFCPQRRRCRR